MKGIGDNGVMKGPWGHVRVMKGHEAVVEDWRVTMGDVGS